MLMKKIINPLTLIFLVLAILGCTHGKGENATSEKVTPQLITLKATLQTQALYKNLTKLSANHLLFGHQNTTAYGVNWTDEEDRSDVKDVTGSYPAVFGWDLGRLGPDNEEGVNSRIIERLSKEIKNTYKRGGISTISWHMRNPVTGGNSWTKDPTVAKLIPGGIAHDKLKAHLDLFVAFNESLKVQDADGKSTYVPIIFRPWHEHNGDWFWWGKGPSNEEDFIALWRFTVDYLRNEKGLRNLIYAFSPDRSRMDTNNLYESYFYAYPGDNYVDIIGLDNYWDLGHPANTASMEDKVKYFVESLEAITDIAQEKNKIAALTEGGQETIWQDAFWTSMILSNVMANEKSKRISYFLVWRNANKAREERDHFYASYPGHKSEADFKAFYNSPFTMFENQLPDMYK